MKKARFSIGKTSTNGVNDRTCNSDANASDAVLQTKSSPLRIILVSLVRLAASSVYQKTWLPHVTAFFLLRGNNKNHTIHGKNPTPPGIYIYIIYINPCKSWDKTTNFPTSNGAGFPQTPLPRMFPSHHLGSRTPNPHLWRPPWRSARLPSLPCKLSWYLSLYLINLHVHIYMYILNILYVYYVCNMYMT